MFLYLSRPVTPEGHSNCGLNLVHPFSCMSFRLNKLNYVNECLFVSPRSALDPFQRNYSQDSPCHMHFSLGLRAHSAVLAPVLSRNTELPNSR